MACAVLLPYAPLVRRPSHVSRATSLAVAAVPAQNGGRSKAPSRPVQTTAFAARIRENNWLIDAGPQSVTIARGGQASTDTT